ncbi:uncharacterized protein LOC135400112 [Ornithodoros turicata]|uniref:uncharacterized protein LOC135400112 n=1 Tax=Ornithodoros turicata TaxID=34597 RepID=UPI003139512E
MKVVIFSLMLLALLQLATSDCERARTKTGECVKNLPLSAPFRDINFAAVRTQADRQNVICCGVNYIEGCVNKHFGTECPRLVAATKEFGRDVFLRATESGVTCPGALPTNCDSLPSLFSV